MPTNFPLFTPQGGGSGAGISSYTTVQRDALSATDGLVIYNTTLGRTQFYSSATGIWNDVGSPLDINYVANYNAESSSTAGWATYADAAGAQPVDGTGGSPTVTWTITNSPLRDNKSFLFTKTAVNSQGQGASYSFTISPADQGKVLQVSCDYLVSSGTYSGGTSSTDSDLTCYIYDVTNAVVIQPSGFKLDNGRVYSNVKATFQTNTNSTSYRLIWHCATTSASAFTVTFDNVYVSPIVTTNGAAMSDWQPYTLTIGAVTTPPTQGTNTQAARWRRVGDSAEIEFFIAQTVAGTAGSGTYLFPLPPGLVADTNKVTPTTVPNVSGGHVVGHGVSSNNNVNNTATASSTVAFMYNNTSIALLANNNASGTPVWLAIGSGFFTFSTATNNLSFRALVPIAGWSSNTQVSQDTDTRVVAAAYNCLTAQTCTAGNTILYVSPDFDTHSGMNLSTGVYTVQVPGYYEIDATTLINASTTTGIFRIGVYKGSTLLAYGSDSNDSNNLSRAPNAHAFATSFFFAGETISVKFEAGTWSSLNSTIGYNRLNIQRLSGPSQIAATESINMKYTNTAGTAIANTGFTNVPFANRVYDSHNSYNTATGIYTVPAPGRYRVACTMNFASATYGVNNQIIAAVYKNGAADTLGGVEPIMAIVTLPFGGDICSTVQCLQGDQIEIRLQNTRSGGATNLDTAAGYNHLEIERVGN